METITTLSQKYQIVIPKPVRKIMGLKTGVSIFIQSIDEEHAMITKHPMNSVQAMKGLGKDVWKKLGGTARYLNRERTAWGK